MSPAADLGDISTWTQALWDQHRQPNISDRHVVAYALARRLVGHDSPSTSEWKFLIDDGFHNAVLDILNDRFLCGIGEDSFRTSGLELGSGLETCREMLENHHIPYLIDIIVLLKAVLDHIERASLHTEHTAVPIKRGRYSICPECDSIKPIVETVAAKYATGLESLWRAANPLLTYYIEYSSPRTYPATIDVRSILDDSGGSQDEWPLSLDILIGSCWKHYLVIVQRIGTDPDGKARDCVLRHAYLMFCIWIHTEGPEDWALQSMITALSGCEDRMTLAQFFAEAADGTVIRQEDVFELLTWYMSTMSSSRLFFQAMQCVVGFRPDISSDISIRGSDERALLWFTMAACRTMLCSAFFEQSDNMCTKAELNGDCVARVCSYLVRMFGNTPRVKKDSEKPPVPELWVYSMIVFASSLAILIAEDTMEGIRGAINRTEPLAWELARMVRYYVRHPPSKASSNWTSREPASPSIRRFTLRAWKTARDKLMSKRAPTQPHLRPLFNGWRQLGEDLEASDAFAKARATLTPEVRDFGPLERCALDQCECSVFEATHPMKVCRGCLLVAYCNENCQRRDWKNHREVCGKMP